MNTYSVPATCIRSKLCGNYLVCLVVILGVVFEHLWLLFILEVADQVVQIKFFSPFLALYKPILPGENCSTRVYG